ncbi:MAG: hypothetical protein KKF79_01375 [Gammaproteobacteria bacterium]|jgi:hypothetical protein|nr:hypothetical protein [Gammaproteobacteria bacterium]
MRAAILAVCLVVSGLGLMGCGGGQSVETQPVPQSVQPGKYMFAVTFDNYAWGQQHRGLVIKGNGDLYTFDLSETGATLTDNELFDETALTRYFEAAKFEFVQALSKEELDPLWRNSLTISNNTLGERASICRDAGGYQYLMFQPVGPEQIKKVQIYQTGDFRQEQLNPTAAPLKAYLMKLALEQKIAWKLDPNGNNWCSGM